MIFRNEDFERRFTTNEACLEWLKNQRYPNDIECKICKKITKHHKVSNRPCYACDSCGNQIYPTSGTIFHKSKTPLKTWFEVIHKISAAKGNTSINEIRHEYGMTYKTAKCMLQKISEFLNENSSVFIKAKDIRNRRGENQASTRYIGPKNKKPITQIIQRKAVHNSTSYYWKRDRTARLLKLQMLLQQSSSGMEIKAIASKCAISKRTVYRDLQALESELGVPIWEKNHKRGIVEGYSLPPISFTPEEAMNIFLAIRLMQSYSYFYNESMISTFIKLNMIVPETLRNQINNVLENLESQPRNEQKTNNFNKLAKAWMTRHSVKIRYQDYSEERPIESVIQPYYIEPSTLGHSSYLIAYCPLMKSIYTYKMDLFIDVSIENDTYIIPSDFKVTDYIDSPWDVHVSEPELVKIRFSRKIREPIMHTIWHPSQKMEQFSDGSGIMTLKVRNSIYFRAWIFGWADDMEVIEPETLRNQIASLSLSLAGIYYGKINFLV